MTQEERTRTTCWRVWTASHTKEHEEEKHTAIRKEKIRKVGSKAQKQENRIQGDNTW